MSCQDLLSAALDECGLDLNDLTAQLIPLNEETPETTPKLQILQSISVPSNVKPPFESLLSNTFNKNGNRKISVTTYQLLNSPTIASNPTQSYTIASNSLLKSKGSLLKQEVIEEKQIKLDEEVEEEEFTSVSTFSDYKPSKLLIGLKHPDSVVETASLSSVLPPDVYYRLSIPEETIDEGKLSALQLESVIYACQQHDAFLGDGSRAGFLIGDGAGVGKGRTIAGIIYENFLKGRKRSVWLSVSTDLKYDAERDFYDIGANKIEIHLLNKFKYGYKIHAPENDNVKRGVIFSTYSSLISESTTVGGKYRSRFGQLYQWCGEDFDGVIVFDECHKAKNLFPSSGYGKPTKTGLAVLELQNKLPKARIVYASATGASEPKNMGYMTRLGIWGKGTPFDDFGQFVSTVEKRGVGAMELVAIDLKMRGMYMARQLSFAGVNFRIEQVRIHRDFVKLYNKCVHLWVEAKFKFEAALDLMGSDNVIKKTIWTQFWASHQRFFKYLCIASKVKFAVNLIKEALRADKSVVIGLQSTGEARTLEQLEENGGELNDFVSTAKSVMQSLIEKHFPAPNRKKLLKILGRDTSFFDDLGITLKRNSKDEVVAVTDCKAKKASSSAIKTDKSLRKARNSNANKSNDSDFSDDKDSSSSDDNDSSSEFNPSESEVESDDISEELSDNDSPFSDDLSDDDSTRKRKRKSNFQNIFLNKKPKTKRIKLKKKPVKRPRINLKDLKDFEGDNMAEKIGDYCSKMRDELLQRLEKLGNKLPANTLDELIDELGGPENVAEMTGRKGRVVSTDEGIQYETRSENDVSLEMLNLVEKQRFMDDEKRVAIISEAASSGISLHSDKRAKNKWRRVHVTVELPWSADRAIQQFGRTHRSNQAIPPEYVFLISDLAGEQRFASIVAKRLESLGALTHGDRRAAESRDLSKFNIDNKYGREALEIVMKSIVKLEPPMVSPPSDYEYDFFKDCSEGLVGVGLVYYDSKTGIYSLDKDYAHMTKFLNRLLGMEVEVQNALFKYFSDTMEAVIRLSKRMGRYDSGIIDLSSEVGNVKHISEESYIMKSSSGAIKIQLHTVSIDRGMSWNDALKCYNQPDDDNMIDKSEYSFYINSSSHMIRNSVILAIPDNSNRNNLKKLFRIYKPNSGIQSKCEVISSLREKFIKSNPEDVESLWKDIYDLSETHCNHVLWYGNCRRVASKQTCDIGFRKRIYCILSGAVLTVWPELERAIPYLQNHRLQIVRLKTEDERKFIGPMIPPSHIEIVKQTLFQLQKGQTVTNANF